MDEEIDNPALGLDHCGFIRSEVSLTQVRPPYPAEQRELGRMDDGEWSVQAHQL